MEKAHDGNYAAVRDLGRLSLIVEDIALVPDVLAALCGCADFEVIRIKNRLDPGYRAVESAGYRDVQVLVRERKGGWIVEVQVIPKEMYELKKSCGHTGYTKYRFILEACKRARVQKAANAFMAGTSRAQKAAAASERAAFSTVVASRLIRLALVRASLASLSAATWASSISLRTSDTASSAACCK